MPRLDERTSRVKVNATGLYTYPDVVIVCDEPQFEDKVMDTLLNPRVVVEVLSDSTEKYRPRRQVRALSATGADSRVCAGRPRSAARGAVRASGGGRMGADGVRRDDADVRLRDRPRPDCVGGHLPWSGVSRKRRPLTA